MHLSTSLSPQWHCLSWPFLRTDTQSLTDAYHHRRVSNLRLWPQTFLSRIPTSPITSSSWSQPQFTFGVSDLISHVLRQFRICDRVDSRLLQQLCHQPNPIQSNSATNTSAYTSMVYPWSAFSEPVCMGRSLRDLLKTGQYVCMLCWCALYSCSPGHRNIRPVSYRCDQFSGF